MQHFQMQLSGINLILNKLILNNFKVYYGIQEVDLSIKDFSSPLIIIGGHNGTGKTTIIEAIKLCLFGDKAKQLLNGYKSYNNLLTELHNYTSRNEESNSFGVEVQFVINDTGANDILSISRTWVLGESGKYKESLFLKRNGKELQFILKEFWQEYINEISPIGLSEILYFDSEEFRRIPDYLSNGYIDSLWKYLGVDLYLELDIDKYKLYRGGLKDEKLKKEVEDFLKKKELSEKKIKELELEKHTLLGKIDSDIKNISTNEDKLKKRAGKSASIKNQLIKEKEKILNDLQNVRKEYEALCSSILPFYICSNLSIEVIDQLKLEREIKGYNSAQKDFSSIKKDLTEELKSDLDNATIKKVLAALKRITPDTRPKGKIIHDLSSSQSNEVISYLNKAVAQSKKSLMDNRKKNKRLMKDRDRIIRDISEIEHKGPNIELFNSISDLNKSIGKHEERISQIEKQTEKEASYLEYLETKLNAGTDKLRELSRQDIKIDLAERVQAVIQTHKIWLAKKKFDEVRSHFNEIINKLSTKGDIVKDIHISDYGDKLIFIGRYGKKLSTKDLSSGESELVALGLLWALHKASEKQHPIITDSPFNRLDENHRKRVVEYFIKPLGSQLIFLSTDKEIETLQQYNIEEILSKSLSIKHDPSRKSSSFVQGYFKND